MTTVLVADDQALVRGGFRLMLDAQDDIDVVGEAEDGRGGGARRGVAPGCRSDGRPHAGHGFLLKSAPPAQLIEAVRTVAAGDALLAPAITRRLVEEFVRGPRPGDAVPPGLQELTDREREVLELMAQGLSMARSPTGSWSAPPP